MDTSLTAKDFQEVYDKRWGVEDYFKVLKSRLSLENFTGYSVESVKQDVWASIYISNLESMLTYDLEEEINEQKSETQLPVRINQSISFNTIKHKIFDLLCSDRNPEEIVEEMIEIFSKNTTVIRLNRESPRRKPSSRRSLHYCKTKKKNVF